MHAIDAGCLILQATVICSLPGELEVILTTNTIATAPFDDSTQVISNRSTALAQDASRLLGAVGFDYFYVAILVGARMYRNNQTEPVTAFNFPFRFYQNSTIEWLNGSTIMTSGAIWRNPSQATLIDATT